MKIMKLASQKTQPHKINFLSSDTRSFEMLSFTLIFKIEVVKLIISGTPLKSQQDNYKCTTSEFKIFCILPNYFDYKLGSPLYVTQKDGFHVNPTKDISWKRQFTEKYLMEKVEGWLPENQKSLSTVG